MGVNGFWTWGGDLQAQQGGFGDDGGEGFIIAVTTVKNGGRDTGVCFWYPLPPLISDTLVWNGIYRRKGSEPLEGVGLKNIFHRDLL